MLYFTDTWVPNLIYISSGILINLQYTIISVSLGIVIAIILAISKTSKSYSARILADGYTSIFRGTPLIIQLSLIYYALPSLIGIKISVFTSTILSFSLNSGAYVSEILRSGINGVDVGQTEAAKALGIPKYFIIKDIVLPQAFRKILPALINELVNILKETSIISIIGEAEILRRANMVAGEKFSYLIPMLTAAVTYYLVVLILVTIANKLEKKLEL
jgi:polar amino acid transport system permease protein